MLSFGRTAEINVDSQVSGAVKFSSHYEVLNIFASLLWDTGDLDKIPRKYSVWVKSSCAVSKDLNEMGLTVVVTLMNVCGASEFCNSGINSMDKS